MVKIINHKTCTTEIINSKDFEMYKQMLPSYCTYEYIS